MIECSPLVSVLTLAYNHEKYIRECIEGIINQHTTFKFELIIHDDASTDGTAEIIKEYERRYPTIIKPVYQDKNQFSKGIPIGKTFLYPCAKGKYIALCEGDDYWTDPLKLQKQVDFLENNEDYGLVHSLAQGYFENGRCYSKKMYGEFFFNIDDLLIANRIVTLTVCFRKKIYIDYENDITPQSSWKMGDYPLWLYIASCSKVHFIDEVMGTYRILEESSSHSKDLQKNLEFCLSSYAISRFFSIRFHKQYLLKKIRRHAIYSLMYVYILLDRVVDLNKCREIGFFCSFDLKMIVLYLLSCHKLGRKLLIKRCKYCV